MKIIKVFLSISLLLLISGCATTQVAFEPQGSRDQENCIESNNCIIKTDNGEAILSIGDVSAVTLNFVNENATQSEGAENKYYDYLATITNTSAESITFDPENISGYDPEKEVAALKSSANFAKGMAIGMVLLGGAVGGTDGALQVLASPELMQMFTYAQLDQEKVFEKENEFSEQKIPVGNIAPEEVIAGRLILDAEKVAHDYGDTKQHKITVVIPVGPDTHYFNFIKRLVAN